MSDNDRWSRVRVALASQPNPRIIAKIDFRVEYLWTDPHHRKQTSIPATSYVDYVMTWVQNIIDDESIFPTKAGNQFPTNFPTLSKQIYRELLRVFAHIYYAHFTTILHLRSEPHFNSLFAHFLDFGREFGLLEFKDIKGTPAAPVCVGDLWEKWIEKGILER